VPRGSAPTADRQTRISAARVHNDRVEAVLFIGVQGSGKSTFYHERFFRTHVRINLDMLRTRQREQILLNACIEARQSFVIDNTNALESDRARYIPLARASGFRVIAYFFETTLADAIRRNNQRSGKQKVPTAALAATFRKLQPPRWEEGFDAIYTITLSSENIFRVQSQSREARRQAPE
jgi:predicted kinase